MAKKCSVARNKRRIRRSKVVRALREKIKSIIRANGDDRDDAVLKLQKCKRDDSPVRVRNRCRQCGRPNGTYRRFGLCRLCLRKAAMKGDIPGLKKASW